MSWQILQQPEKLNLSTNSFPQQLRLFNVFVGYKEITNRIARLSQKVVRVRALSDVIQRRYAFAFALDYFYSRLSVSRPINFDDAFNYRAASTIAAINSAIRTLSDRAQKELKGRILDGLQPDRDFRNLEHELRCFVHLVQNGFSVRFADLEGIGSFDFLATKSDCQLEIECKTVSEDVGRPISTDQSFIYFEKFADEISTYGKNLPSGILNMEIEGSHQLRPPEIGLVLRKYLSESAPDRRTIDSTELWFEPRDDWNALARQKQFHQLQVEVHAAREQINPHTGVIVGPTRAVMFNLSSKKTPHVVRRTFETIKSASRQLSGHRPGIIWIHFLGLTEQEFTSLTQEAKGNGNSVFDAMSNYAYRSQERAHLKKMFFSADCDAVERSRLIHPILGDVPNFVMNGPVYETTNLVSKFPTQIAL